MNEIKKYIAANEPKMMEDSSPHPSPLSAYRGFFGSHPFSRANQYLVQHNETPINWQ